MTPYGNSFCGCSIRTVTIFCLVMNLISNAVDVAATAGFITKMIPYMNPYSYFIFLSLFSSLFNAALTSIALIDVFRNKTTSLGVFAIFQILNYLFFLCKIFAVVYLHENQNVQILLFFWIMPPVVTFLSTFSAAMACFLGIEINNISRDFITASLEENLRSSQLSLSPSYESPTSELPSYNDAINAELSNRTENGISEIKY